MQGAATAATAPRVLFRKSAFSLGCSPRANCGAQVEAFVPAVSDDPISGGRFGRAGYIRIHLRHGFQMLTEQRPCRRDKVGNQRVCLPDPGGDDDTAGREPSQRY